MALSDWTGLAGIVSTATVAVSAQVIGATTKRGDRKHEVNLDYEKRIWDAKSAALVSVIAKCERLKHAAENYPTGNRAADAARRRHMVVMEFGDIDLDLTEGEGAELLAYADKSVREPVAKLSKMLSHEYFSNYALVADILLYRAKFEKAFNEFSETNPVGAGDSPKKLEEAETALGNASNLDVDAVVTLCDRILDAARKDLRGR